MKEPVLNTDGQLYPKTKNYYQKVFFRKLFGKKLYKFFKYFKIILLNKLGVSFEISEFLKQVIEKDFIIIDVGANLGQYAVRFGKLLKDGGKLISIEPVYEDFLYLNKLKEKYKLHNMECRNYAISDYEGEGLLYIPVIENDIELDTRATIDPDNYYFNYGKYNTQKIKVRALDSLYKEMSLLKVDIIKSDTEGNDSKVLKGALELIKRFFPLILIEDSHKEKWLDEIYDTGYQPFYVINNLYLIDAYNTTGNEKNIKYDLLVLIHRSKISAYSKFIKES
jgi:FkbM family methyltransferase